MQLPLSLSPAPILITPCARMRSRGRVIGQFVCLCVCVYPPLFGLFAPYRHLQVLIQLLTGKSWGKNGFYLFSEQRRSLLRLRKPAGDNAT